MNSIFTRRSVRSFLAKPVEAEKVDKMLRAAMQAPSAMNQQPWEFMVFDDKEQIDLLSKFSKYSRPLDNAPLAFVLLYRCENMPGPGFIQQDMGACMENLLLEAVELGLGCVWMGVDIGSEREEYICEKFNLPQGIKPYGVVACGYPDKEDANHFTDRFDAARVHMNKF